MLALLRRSALCFLAIRLAATAIPAQQPAPTPAEARAVAAFTAAKQAGPPELYAFLVPMPKGADLHMHLSGAVYAETFLRDAVAQGLCIDPDALAFKDPASPCPEGQKPASTVLTDQHLYDQLVDAFSMRAFAPSEGFNGHDQFFATFGRFSGAWNPSEWLDEVATRAASQQEQYLEIMNTPSAPNLKDMIKKGLAFPSGVDDTNYRQLLDGFRTQLLASPLAQDIPLGIKMLADQRTQQRAAEHCDSPTPPRPSAACKVAIHWIYQVARANPPQNVFAQTLIGFEIASRDPQDVVGINFVQPEDARIAMADYHLHMLMLDYLHSIYPGVRISLHAGELAPGLVSPDGLSFHIRQAVELGHASRIGHGVDVLYETDPNSLLKELAAQHVMVEINLTSNDVILGIKGADHPLHAYLNAHVPVALSTDDEGVSRIDLTHEYVRAAEDQGLGYLDLKRMARTSLEHAFLHGQSLWAAQDDFTQPASVCAGPLAPSGLPPGPCGAFLAANERAFQQYVLEQSFAAFEATIH
jgi:adenosine deaminase